jgi:hypothetical protein
VHGETLGGLDRFGRALELTSIERRLARVGWTSRSSEPTANARSIAATVYKAHLGKQAATMLAFSTTALRTISESPAR